MLKVNMVMNQDKKDAPIIGFEDADELINAIDQIMAEKPEHYKKLAKL